MASAKDVYSIIRNNGAVPAKQQPTESQLRYYADLVERTGVKFATDDYARRSWTGRTNWQMNAMIDSLKRELRS
jgi:hypothetical protein